MGREIMAPYAGRESGWLLACPQLPDRGHDLRGSPHGGCVKPRSRPPQPQWASSTVNPSPFRRAAGGRVAVGRRQERRPGRRAARCRACAAEAP